MLHVIFNNWRKVKFIGNMFWIYLFACFVLLYSTNGHSRYQRMIPNGWNVKHPCNPDEIWNSVGHMVPNYAGGAGISDKNLFGQLWRSSEKVWNRAICEADSDGDGFSNGKELGDENCDWKKIGDHLDPVLGHPGFCEPQRATCSSDGSYIGCPHQGSGQSHVPARSRASPGVGGGRIDRGLNRNMDRDRHRGMGGDRRMGGPIDRSMGGPIDGSIGGPIDRSMGGPIDRNMGGHIDRSIGRRIDRRMGGPIDRSMGGPIDRRMSGPIDRSMGGPKDRSMARGRGIFTGTHGGGRRSQVRGGRGSDRRRESGASDRRRGGGASDIRRGGGDGHRRVRPDTTRRDGSHHVRGGGGIERRFRENLVIRGTPGMRSRSDTFRTPRGDMPTGISSRPGSRMRVGDRRGTVSSGRDTSTHTRIDPSSYIPPTPLYPGRIPAGSDSRLTGFSSEDSSRFAEIPSLDPSLARSSFIGRMRGDRTPHGRTSGGSGTYDRTHETMTGGSLVYDRVSRRPMPGGYGMTHYVPPGPPHRGSSRARHFIYPPPPYDMRRSRGTSSAGAYPLGGYGPSVMYPSDYP